LKLAHAIMTDAYGRTVRVGLSFEETDEFEHLQKVLNRGRSSFEDSFDEWERSKSGRSRERQGFS
jgi:hypothetical protein